MIDQLKSDNTNMVEQLRTTRMDYKREKRRLIEENK